MLKNYIKTAYKVFLRRKFFTFISLFAVSFTLIVLMVAAAFFDNIFGSLPPEKKLDRTLNIFYAEMSGQHITRSGTVGYGFLDRYCRDLPNVEKFSIYSESRVVYSYKDGEKIESYLKRTDGEFWEIMEFDFLEGRPITAEDEKNRNFVAVINEATKKKFFGDQPAVGKTIEADAQHFRVVGVVKNVSFFRELPFADIWVPISASKSDTYRSEYVGDLMALILAKSSSDFPAIKEEFNSRLPRVEFPDSKDYNKLTSNIETYIEYYSRQFPTYSKDPKPGTFFAAVIGLTILFMLLPTVNLININVSRIMERAGEIGVRKAFGASSLILIGQFVVENLLLTLIGGAVGLVGSYLVLQAITQSNILPYAEFNINYRIFFYGLIITLFFGLFSGVYPAWKMSRLNPVEALKGGRR